MFQVEVIVLANSIKHKQHCIAGKCNRGGGWIRPVSDEQGAELSHDQARYQNKFGIYTVRPLQKIYMQFDKRVPLLHQPENCLINDQLWTQNYVINACDLSDYLDQPHDLWGDDNKIEYNLIRFGDYKVKQSLYLVQVDNLELYTTDQGKRRASFAYNHIEYDFAVTDPRFDEIVSKQYKVSGILCISLGEVYQGYCYKLVATIF